MSANPRQPDSPPTLNMASGPSAVPPDNADTDCHVDDNAKDVLASTADDLNDNAKQQEEPTKVTTLNEGELRALLDEALTYKCPKDRVGKSNLFKELLQEVEADENEEGRRAVTISRYLPGSNRRRHKRDSVSEPLTHGGSLQNLVQPVNSEFESFAYLSAGSSQNCGRRKGRKSSTSQSSVSARQREGGSLPSNVNATHTLAPLASRFDLIFDKKAFGDEPSGYNWTKKESQIQEKSSTVEDKKEEKKEDKESEKRGPNMLISAPNSTSSEYQKPECMVIDLSSIEISYQVNSSNSLNATASNAESMMAQSGEEGGIEMKVIEPRGSAQYVSTLDIPQTPVETAVDTFVKFPLHDSASSDNRTRVLLNDADGTSTIPFQYNNMRVFSGPSNGFAGQSNKNIGNVYSVVPFLPRSSAMEEPSEKKSFDENGNALHGYNTERKKARRKHTQEPNVIVYQSENVQGHRNDDIESLVNFIENTSKNKRSAGKSGAGNSNTMRVKSTSGNSKSRSRDKDTTKREQMANNLQRCNSLEEVSKTKLEDLTVEKSTTSNEARNVYQHEPPNSAGSLRMGKAQNDWDKSANSGNRGDRRSWGTEDGQFIYCNNSNNDYNVLRSSTNKLDVEYEGDTEFLVVSKKKKSKKRRSSSGSRAQQLSDSGVYLQSSSDFYPRSQLSSELRRKSASSMPPSDKSDSSDVDSVHSLPVTSNSSQHASKMPSGNSPAQASYAEITRMAAMNVSADNVSVLNSSNIAGCNLSRTAASTPFESKFNDYPSLDEVQHSVDRKSRQHQFVRASNRGMNHSFDSNATLLKYNDKEEKSNSVEAINKVYHSLADTEENMTRQNMNATVFSSASSTSEEASSLEFGVKSPPPADAKVKIETEPEADDKSAAKAKSTKVTKSVVKNVPPVKSRKSSNSRPPVILLDEVICGSSKEHDSSSELTFGFDINEQLLRNEEEKVNEVVPVIVERSVETVVEKSAEKRVDKSERKMKLKIVETLVIEDFCARFEQPPDKVFNFNNMEKVISHHKTAWNDMIQSNHVQFYSGQ